MVVEHRWVGSILNMNGAGTPSSGSVERETARALPTADLLVHDAEHVAAISWPHPLRQTGYRQRMPMWQRYSYVPSRCGAQLRHTEKREPRVDWRE